MARWVVTGGAGFIGSHIVETLLSKGETVRVFDDFSTGKEEYLENSKSKIEIVRGDIRDEKMARQAMQGMDYVLHQAAFRSVPLSVEKPRECNSANIDGILNCLIAARDAGVKRFVFASSSSIYGDSKIFPQREFHLPMPVSPYAVSKITGEYYLQVFRKTYGLSTVALRYFNVFGPRQDPKSKYSAVIPKFILAALKNEPIEIHWDGKQSRDFSYVLDVAQANILAATSKNLRQDVYNVACGTTTSLLDIVHILEAKMKKKFEKKFFPRREGDVRKTRANISATKRDLGFKPKFPFKLGLEKTFEFFAENERWRAY